MHSLSQRSTLAHMSSSEKIEETDVENLCSKLPFFEVDSCLHLFHQGCLSLVSLLTCCNVLSQATRLSVMVASPLLRRLAGPGACSAVSRFDGFYTWCCLSLVALRCIIQYLAPRKILLINVGVHAVHFLAVSFLSCGFGATSLYWYWRPSQQRIST